MVLLIPDAIRKIRADERKRIRKALLELIASKQSDGQVTLNSDEVLKILHDDAAGRS